MDRYGNSQTALSRRRFVQGATGAAVAAGLAGANAWPASARANSRQQFDTAAIPPPKPIAGGIQLPDGSQIHVWAPGPPDLTLPFSGGKGMGLDVEPSTFTDRSGFSALAFHVGTAKGSDGATYNLETDIRAFQGTYVEANGTRRFGTFAFI